LQKKIGELSGSLEAQERLAPVLPFLTSFVPFVVIYSSGYRILREGYLEQ
jgi:hypothetical protein